MSSVDCLVVGAGVIGLAVARALASAGREVIIVERERRIGLHTSSRNSGVIHAGIHYPAGSLRARSCVAGREALYAFCHARGIAHRRCGKLTVAASETETQALWRIAQQGRDAGVEDLTWLSATEAQALEPQLRCHAALLSPSTGIIDIDAYLQSLLAEAEHGGAQLATGTRLSALRATAAGIDVFVDDEAAATLRARWVINCAGLWASEVAAMMRDIPRERWPRTHYAKGSYFALAGRAPFSRLIYPVAGSGSGHLGIHMTLDLAGAARFGPDLEWVSAIRYDVDAGRASAFESAVRSYWPDVPAGALQPAYAGVRPKLSGPREPARDFVISAPQDHGVRGLIHLFGIDSPGLTGSLALAEQVAALATG